MIGTCLSILNRKKVRAWNAWVAEAIPMKPNLAMPSQACGFPAVASPDEATWGWFGQVCGRWCRAGRDGSDQAETTRDAAGVARES
jgi:hypothetical protein